MGSKYCTVSVLEVDKSSEDEFSIVFGKGRSKDDLVYFQLDGSFLRQPDQVKVGGSLQVTSDEEVGRAPGYF